jgi:hypothetical protein
MSHLIQFNLFSYRYYTIFFLKCNVFFSNFKKIFLLGIDNEKIMWYLIYNLIGNKKKRGDIMINRDGLREIWISKGYTQEKLAKRIGLQVRTFRNRLKNGTLTTNDIDKLVDLLDIKNPTSIFFIQCVT